jgi:hypothetical protein
MLDLKPYRHEPFDSLAAHLRSGPRLTSFERSVDADAGTRRSSAAGETWTQSPPRDGASPASATSGLGPAGEIASSLMRASVGFLVSLTLLVVMMAGLAALA